jgi:Helix-turn-helix domain
MPDENPTKHDTALERKVRALANSPKTFLERDDWMRAIGASDLPHAAVRLAVQLALRLHVQTGRCNPTFATLAAASHIPERSVYRLVALLEHLGWLAIQRTSGRLSNQYVLLNPAKAESGLSAANPVTSDRVNPVTTYNPTLTNRASNPANMVAVKKRRTTKRTTKGKKDSRASRSDTQNAPLFAALENPESAGLAEPKQEAVRRKESAARSARISPTEIADSFEGFYGAYPRKVAKDAARKAYGKALERGATPAALLAGAQRYAAERAGQDSKYSKHPATWLNAGCWEDEAPGAPVIDQAGNVVAFAPQEHMDAAAQLAARCHARAKREGLGQW